jgi:hypothetical protein
LRGETGERLLRVVGEPADDRAALIAFALKEIEDSVDAILYVRLGRLFRDSAETASKGLGLLLEDVVHLLDIPRPPGAPLAAWERVVEQIVIHRFVLVIDDVFGGETPDVPLKSLKSALTSLVDRRGAHVVLAGIQPAYDEPLAFPEAEVLTIPEQTFPDVERWIRSHLPMLNSVSTDDLREYFSLLATDLYGWQKVNDLWDPLYRDPPLSDIVREVASRRSASREPMAPAARAPIRVVIAGPFLVGRQVSFANVVLAEAGRRGIAARLAPEAMSNDPLPPFGVLLDLWSPFESGEATKASVLRWLNDAAMQRADIVLIDFGASASSMALEDALNRLVRQGALVVVSSSNGSDPTWPAWLPNVLAVGPLDENGEPFAGAAWDPDKPKPDLFAPGYVVGTALERMLSLDSLEHARGSAFAALHTMVAAVVLWASARHLTASQVSKLLVDGGRSLARPQGAKALDLDAALALVHQGTVLEALAEGPKPVLDVVAGTGLPAPVVETVGERLVAEGLIEERKEGWEIPGLDITASNFHEGSTAVLQLKVRNFRLYSLLLHYVCSVDGGGIPDVRQGIVQGFMEIPAAPFRPSRGVESATVISFRYPDDFTSDTAADLSERVPGHYRVRWDIQIESPVHQSPLSIPISNTFTLKKNHDDKGRRRRTKGGA